MPIEQLHYTSCRHGLGASDGLQVRTSSPGLGPSDHRLIVPMSGYSAPPGLTRTPTPEEIAEAFPIDLRVDHLDDGRTVLLHQAYAGRDYTGRWGNYFTHALVFEELPAGVWPIDLLDADWWVSRLGEGEDERPPRPLAPLSVDLAATPAPASPEDLRHLLGEHPSRVTQLSAMLAALASYDRDPRPVILTGEWSDALMWMSAVQHCLPSRVAWSIPSSTYLSRVKSGARIGIVPPESEVSFTSQDRSAFFYVFDVARPSPSDGDAARDGWAKTVPEWMRSNPVALAKLMAFCDGFDLTLDAACLDEVLRLFELGQSGEGSLTSQQLLDALDVIRRRARPEGREAGMSFVGTAIRNQAARMRSDDVTAMLEGLVAIDDGTSAEHAALSRMAWLVAARRLLERGEGSRRALLEARRTVASTPRQAQELLVEVLEAADGPSDIRDVVDVLVDLVGVAGPDGWLGPVLAGVAPRIGSPEGFEYVARAATEAGATPEAVATLFGAAAPEAAAGGMASWLRSAPSPDALLAATAAMSVPEAWAELGVARIEVSSDPAATWREIATGPMPDGTSRERFAVDLATSVFRTRPPSSVREPLAMAWVVDGTADRMASDVRSAVVATVSRAIPARTDHTETDPVHYAVFELRKGTGGAVDPPDRWLLRQWLRTIATETSRALIRRQLGTDLQRHVAELDGPDELQQFLDDAIEILVTSPRKLTEQSRLLRDVYPASARRPLSGALERHLKASDRAGDLVDRMGRLVLLTFVTSEPHDPVWHAARPKVEEWVDDLKQQEWLGVRGFVADRLPENLRTPWEEIAEALTRSKRGFIAKTLDRAARALGFGEES